MNEADPKTGPPRKMDFFRSGLKKAQKTRALTCLRELASPDPKFSVRHQCELLKLCRSGYHYQCRPETEEDLALMRRLDELHVTHPV